MTTATGRVSSSDGGIRHDIGNAPIMGRADVDTGMAKQRGHRDGIASDDVPPRIPWGTGGAWVMVALSAAHTP